MRHGSLFSGIGGFDLAAEWMGWENVFHCEISEFPRQILKYHFPNSICYEDIKKTDFTKHRGEIDIISGGFPCQPYSNAGKRRGKEDDRHLWPEMLRVIREVQPRFVVGENVSGLLSWNNGLVFHEIITDLENEGYETQAFHIPACSTNAPHQRFRIWLVAHSNLRGGCRKERLGENDLRGGERKKQNYNIKPSNKGLEQWGEYRTTLNSNGTEQGNNLGENIGKEGEIRWGEESDVSGELCSDGTTADTDNNGREQQRRYDWSGKNDERSNTQSIRTTYTENIDNANSSEFIAKQSEFNRRISEQTNGETKEFTKSRNICKLDKKYNECKEIECRNKCKIDNSRTLVQKGQNRFQLSEYSRMEFNKTNLSSKQSDGLSNDNDRINRMEEYASDTESERTRQQSSEDRGREDRRSDNNGKTWDAADTNGKRYEERIFTTESNKQSGFNSKENFRDIPNWDNFPTQSPICGGDDGISAQLDGITFSKWRNESIKGYGNAVVPQVVYQIFKAIERSILSL